MDETLIQKYLEVKAELHELQERERSLRSALAETYWTPEVGKSKTITTESGLKLAFSYPVYYSIDMEELASLDLSLEEKACLKPKFEIIIKAYKALPANAQLKRAVSMKPGTIQLSVKEGK